MSRCHLRPSCRRAKSRRCACCAKAFVRLRSAAPSLRQLGARRWRVCTAMVNQTPLFFMPRCPGEAMQLLFVSVHQYVRNIFEHLARIMLEAWVTPPTLAPAGILRHVSRTPAWRLGRWIHCPSARPQVTNEPETRGARIVSERQTRNAFRRHFIHLGLKGVAVAPLGFLPINNALARTATTGSTAVAKLPEDDRQAKALGYREDASTVDSTKFKRKDDQWCANCQLYSGEPGSEWGPCAVFSYRVDRKLNKPFEVSAKGWCISWGPRAHAY